MHTRRASHGSVRPLNCGVRRPAIVYVNLPICVVVSTAFLGAGCATVESMGHEPSDEGVSFSVPASCSFVRDALQQALLGLKFTIGTVDDSGACDRDVVATMGISAFSWGELVRVTLREGDANSTVLSVTTKRRLATNIT